MNILITSAGKRVSLIRAFKKELSAVYPQGKIFAVDLDPKLSSACYVADDSYSVPKISHPEYITSLLEICIKNHITLVIPTIDTELLLLSQNKSKFLKVGIKIVVSSESLIQKCRDKNKIHNFFATHKIEIAKQYDKENYELPIFIKPFDGSRSIDTFTILKKEDFTPYHFSNPKLMFLEYLDYNMYDEYTCDLYYDKNNKLKCVVPRKRIQVRDGEVNKGLTERNEIVDYIKKKLSVVEGASGCLTAQFFKHKENHRIVGIEINPRFGGGFPLTYLAGANYVKWIIEEYLFDKPIDDQFNSWESNLLMLRYDDEILVRDFKN